MDFHPQRSLADEFKQLDANKQLPMNTSAAADQVATSANDPALDRRRQIYKNIRKEINQTEQHDKQRQYTEKMSALEAKMQQKDVLRRQQ